MSEFYDTHAHLTWPDFAGDLDGVVQRATEAGITKMVSIGTTVETSGRAVALAEKYSAVYAAVGIHPGDAMEAPEDFIAKLRKFAGHRKVVGIGEIGLDFYRLPGKSGGSAEDDAKIKARQAEVFEAQLQLAAEFGLNVVIHTRESLAATLEQFRPYAAKVRAVFHCFVDDAAAMREVVDLGSLVSFTGICTFKNAQIVRETIAAAPLDKLMLETDSPFLAPVPFRGKRCEPAYVAHIARAVAEIKKITLAELSQATCANARGFFKNLG